MTKTSENSSLNILPEQIETSVCQLLQAYGCKIHVALIMARMISWCEQTGRPNQGLLRLPVLIKRLESRVINGHCKPEFMQQSATQYTLNGDNGPGQYISHIGMSKAIEIAAHEGIGIVGVKNSNWNGCGAYYINQAANKGFIGLCSSNAFPKVAPHGGCQPVFGTNPFAFSAPRQNGAHILLDMATSSSAGSSIRQMINDNKQLSVGTAINKYGQPITDPTQVDQGTLLPFGGYKGYGMALMVEILSAVITGSGISHQVNSMEKDFSHTGNNGHFFLAFDIERFIPLEDYYERIEHLIEIIRLSGNTCHTESTPKIPGENRWVAYQKSQRQGVKIPKEILSELNELANRKNVNLSWQTI